MGNSDKLFVYSEMQIAEEKRIQKNIGRDFLCGDISIGSTRKKYSKIINREELDHMTALYPDTKIIATGSIDELAYTPVTTNYLKG